MRKTCTYDILILPLSIPPLHFYVPSPLPPALPLLPRSLLNFDGRNFEREEAKGGFQFSFSVRQWNSSISPLLLLFLPFGRLNSPSLDLATTHCVAGLPLSDGGRTPGRRANVCEGSPGAVFPHSAAEIAHKSVQGRRSCDCALDFLQDRAEPQRELRSIYGEKTSLGGNIRQSRIDFLLPKEVT